MTLYKLTVCFPVPLVAEEATKKLDVERLEAWDKQVDTAVGETGVIDGGSGLGMGMRDLDFMFKDPLLAGAALGRVAALEIPELEAGFSLVRD